MDRISGIEGNKSSWDYNSVRKQGGMTSGGDIYWASRCDDRSGCTSRPGGSGWKPAGWWMPGH
jgi:hypothetical protein